MRKAFSIGLLACLMLISAFANFGSAYAKPAEDSSLAVEISVERLAQDDLAQDNGALEPSGIYDEAKSDECPCKYESSKTKFVCGVALALLHNAATLYPPLSRKPQFAIYQTTSVKSLVDLLKRPPRTHL